MGRLLLSLWKLCLGVNKKNVEMQGKSGYGEHVKETKNARIPNKSYGEILFCKSYNEC